MENKKPWILLYKNLQNWEWYDNPATKAIFIHCLLNANWKKENWKGKEIKRGQFPTSIEKLAILNGLTVQQARTALKNLQMTNDINIQTTNQYSIITVNKYNFWQPYNKQNGGANNNTINNINKVNKENKNNISYINNSSSSKQEIGLPNLTEEEEEFLKKYSKRVNRTIRSYSQWRKKILLNGDYKQILEEEKQKKKKEEELNVLKKKEKEKFKNDFKKVKDKLSACRFCAIYWNHEKDNSEQAKEISELMDKYKVMTYSEALDYVHNNKKG